MDEKTRRLLEGEIEEHLRGLSVLQSGSKEKTAAINELAILYRLKIDETKNELEFTEKRDNYVFDDEFRKRQLAEQVKDRYFKLGIAAAEITLPLIFYAVWMCKGFKFEENGTYTSTTFRGLFSRFRPTK